MQWVVTSNTQEIRKAGLNPYYASKDGRWVLLEGDCRELMPRLSAAGIRSNLVFADPPYHLSTGGITCHAGRMVSVNKGTWDRSAGAHEDHEFILSWLKPALAVLSDGGSFWVSGTHHVIYSVGYGLQELGAKVLNTIVWEKKNPPPNLACRYFTHSFEFVIWSKRTEKERHVFNYAFEKTENHGKQQKDIWYRRNVDGKGPETMPNHWRISAPGRGEKLLGKHPTQKPLELLDRIVRSTSNPGDLVLDPFSGSGTTGIAALGNGRRFIGIELNVEFLELSKRRYLAWRKIMDETAVSERTRVN